MVPLGMVYSCPSRVVTLYASCTYLMSMISGGWSRRASFMERCRQSILLSTSKSSLSPCSFMMAFCSCSTSPRNLPRYSLECRYIVVQVDVTEEVCCPANRPAMSMPVISSSVLARPPFALAYFASMNDWRMSTCFSPEARRMAMTLAMIVEISFLARSRFRCASMGRYGNSTEMGCMPMSRSWNRSATWANICSRTSFPRRHLEAVMMSSVASSSFRSTSPSSPHCPK
mmetsp:Transcript_28063/g.78493  ORF Transcript_28063/g.78493 Transcript_28063/m.78493 type:complete len:229 (-) Transcript_28063:329-1015(-)